MRGKLIFSLTIILCLTLCSCAGQRNKRDVGNEVRELYEGTDKCTMKAKIKADYGNRAYEFKVRYDFDRDGESVLTILEPEELNGVRTTIDDGRVSLDTGDVTLETGPIGETGLTPAEALPVLLKTFSEGYLVMSGSEKIDDIKYHTLNYKSYFGENVIEYCVWVDDTTLKPYMAQIFDNGYTVIKCEFESFDFE